jgi:hypothetical protein
MWQSSGSTVINSPSADPIRRSSPDRLVQLGVSLLRGRATWSPNEVCGTWAQALTVLHAAARQHDGRAEETPSMVVIGTHLARGVSNGGFTFDDRGGPTAAPRARSASSQST